MDASLARPNNRKQTKVTGQSGAEIEIALLSFGNASARARVFYTFAVTHVWVREQGRLPTHPLATNPRRTYNISSRIRKVIARGEIRPSIMCLNAYIKLDITS